MRYFRKSNSTAFICMRYFIYFSYDGTNYHGWQIQPNAVSVQEKLNWALSTILRSEIETIGAGRTDTGVHASTMVAHFDFLEIENLQNLSAKLCRILPPDISVKEIRKVSETANARFDAILRTYHYHVYTQKNPFLRHYAVQLHFIPDFKLMNEAAAMLLTVDDFTSFSKLGTDVKTNICHVTRAHWVQVDDNLWRFEITANRFLRNMVRAVVGTLLDVGRHKITLSEFQEIIRRKDRCAAGESVPGKALSLVNVVYPDSIFI